MKFRHNEVKGLEYRKAEINQGVRDAYLRHIPIDGKTFGSLTDIREINQMIVSRNTQNQVDQGRIGDDYILTKAIAAIKENGQFETFLANSYISHYNRQNFKNRVFLMMNYLVQQYDSYVHDYNRFTPALYNYQNSTVLGILQNMINAEASNHNGNVGYNSYDKIIAARHLALRHLGRKAYNLITDSDKVDLYKDTIDYIERGGFPQRAMQVVRELFDGFFNNEDIEFPSGVDFNSATLPKYLSENNPQLGLEILPRVFLHASQFNNLIVRLYYSGYNNYRDISNAEGSIIRRLFNDNGPNVPGYITNTMLGQIFDLQRISQGMRVIFSSAELARFSLEAGLQANYFATEAGKMIIYNNALILELARRNVSYFFTSGQAEMVWTQFLDGLQIASDPVKSQMWFSMQCALIKREHPNWSDSKIYWEASRETLQLMLDFGGLAPVVGEVCDLANGVIYTVQGDALNASLSYAAAIPFVGWAATASKFAIKVPNLAQGGFTALKWIKQSNGLIRFGSANPDTARKQLAQVIGAFRTDFHAHHMVPWEFNNSALIQKAAKAFNKTYHPNAIENGFKLLPGIHLNGHHRYNAVIEEIFTRPQYNNLTNEQAAVLLERLQDHIRSLLQNNPNLNLGQIADLINFN